MYAGEKNDTESTRSLVTSRNTIMKEKHPYWCESLRMLALGILHAAEIRDAHMRELAHFLYISVGEDYLRANDGHMYLYNDGAFSIFTGVIPESLLSMCKIYAQQVEGALWCVGRMGLLSRSPPDILDALNSAFVDINGVPLCDIEGISKGAGKGESDGQRLYRSWVEKKEVASGEPFAGECGKLHLEESEIIRALYYLASDFWEVRIASKTWPELDAANAHFLSSNLQG